MFIEKYTVHIKDLTGKKSKKIKVDENDPISAHKKALDQCNQLTQDISKIVDFEDNIVYTIDKGFYVQ
jgi:ribosome maturation factor RimP